MRSFCVKELIFGLFWLCKYLTCGLCVGSPSDKPPESIGMVNGETLKQVNIRECLLSVRLSRGGFKTFFLFQIPPSDSPSPPPGLTKPSLVVPISVSDLTARSPFEGAAAESQSLFSDNSNFRHPNPLPAGLPPFPPSPRSNSDWPMTPEPQSLFTSGTEFYIDTDLLVARFDGLTCPFLSPQKRYRCPLLQTGRRRSASAHPANSRMTTWASILLTSPAKPWPT